MPKAAEKNRRRLPSGNRALLACKALALAFFAVAALNSCAPSQIKNEEQPAQRALVWPSLPEPARISYYSKISKPEDIGAKSGFFDKVVAFLLGPSENSINKPYGLTVDSKGRMIVADTAFKRVHVFDLKKRKYFHMDETDSGEMLSPIGVAVDAEDNIFVTDSVRGSVYIYSSAGRFRKELDGFSRPTGIAVNKKTGVVYIVDTTAHQVRMFSVNGAPKGAFGSWGSSAGQFNYPVDISIDSNGDVYVVDTMNYKVQRFTGDGEFISLFGRQGDGSGDLGRPKGVAVDSDGNIYVADALFDTVQIFDKDGNFLLSFGSVGGEPGKFWLPCGIFIDDSNRIYVADSYNRRVQIFDYIGQQEP